MPDKTHHSSFGPSSHRSPSSPLPADALEYFSETAARMGNSGASGMMIQSPDGRPAGIFFQPKPSSSLGSRTPGSLTGRRPSVDERFGLAATANQNRMLNGGSQSNFSGSNSSSGNASPHKGQAQSPQKGAAKPTLTLSEKPNGGQSIDEEASKAESSTAVQESSPMSPTSPTRSFGDGLPRLPQKTFTSGAPATTVSRPSAQPQAGLLIGAGFTPSSKKGGGPKKVSANMEILPPIKVLIVEDNMINVKILSKFLKERKIQFGVASNGREAVDQWQTGGYHLILMDIQLPVMDGIEATKEIRRLERGANIGPINSTTPPALAPLTTGKDGTLMPPAPSNGAQPEAKSTGMMSPSTMLNSLKASVIIVALTASILNSDRVAALAAGCNDFLNKPVNLRWLERKVIEWGSMQYLIGFRDINDDIKKQKRYQSLTAREVSRSNGLVEEGFGTGPNRLAQEMAGRLHIGNRRVK